MITLKDIARETGLDFRSVSDVLRDDPRYNVETRRRVLATAHQMGYVPHHAARRLAATRTDASRSFDQVGLIYLPGPNATVGSVSHMDSVCQVIMGGAEHELSKLNAALTFLRVSEPGDWGKVERMARAGSIDGWLIYGPLDDKSVAHLNAADLPYVILGDHQCSQPVNCVNIDNEQVGRLAVQRLASLGHRRIGFLAGPLMFPYQRQALAGFRAAVKALGLDEDERLIATSPSVWDDLNPVPALEWLRATSPTAIFALEPGSADSLHRRLKEIPVRVPHEISILGCEIVSETAKLQNFTRIELPMIELGDQGALRLHRLATAAPDDPRELKVAPTLLEGWSTRPPNLATNQD